MISISNLLSVMSIGCGVWQHFNKRYFIRKHLLTTRIDKAYLGYYALIYHPNFSRGESFVSRSRRCSISNQSPPMQEDEATCVIPRPEFFRGTSLLRCCYRDNEKNKYSVFINVKPVKINRDLNLNKAQYYLHEIKHLSVDIVN